MQLACTTCANQQIRTNDEWLVDQSNLYIILLHADVRSGIYQLKAPRLPDREFCPEDEVRM